ncbi:YfgM family protein [Piscinibacter sakaiensis]|uniref:YfgM family protein n=1 Tax=Piscinibacter sakaiensis TaxID=1547922 RepID=UPI003AAF5D12
MATQLDLEEQEQLDQLKAFWKQYGNLITWLLIAVLGSFAAWNGWNWWQREQAVSASGMYDELDKAVGSDDVATASRIFDDLKSRYPRTAYAQQAGMLAAKLQHEKGQSDAAQATLRWVAEEATDTEYRALAHLRLAGLLLDAQQYDAALKQLDAAEGKEFEALVADRRGDILQAQGKLDEAKAAYQQAWKAFDSEVAYRRLVEAKLTALGAAPEAAR